MNLMWEHIIGGAIGGIVATPLCLFFAKIWIEIVRPWYEELLYHDAKIEGNWEGVVDGIGQRPDIVELKRKGHGVWGTMHVFGQRAGDYEFQGSFRNLILSLTYAAIDRAQLNRGSITAMLKDNGQQLIGKCVHYDGTTTAIAAQDYAMKRA